MIINRQNLTIAHTAFNAAFSRGFEGVSTDFEQMVLEVPSTTSVEHYGWLGHTTQFREWIGDRVINSIQQHDYSIKNKTYENTVGVPREAIEDDQYGIYAPLMQQMGQDAKEHPGSLVWNLLKAGDSTLCYDGQNFFDNEHPVLGEDGEATLVSNDAGGSAAAWYLLDLTRVIKPMILQKRRDYKFVMKTDDKDDNVFERNEFIYGADARLNVGFGLWQLAYKSKQTLNATNFNAAYSAFQSLKGDHGRPLGIRPSLLVVPPTLRATALEVVKAERSANGATNINRDVVDVLSTPWLA